MKTSRRPLLVALAAGVSLCAAAAFAADRTESGRALVIPAEHAELGTPYHVHFGRDAQITFTSDAPLEHIKGTSNRVVGYAITDKDKGAPHIAAAEFRLPVDSLRTGIEMHNQHLQEPRWLDAPSFPDIVFTIDHTQDVTLEKEADGFKTYSATLVGDMTIRDATRDIQIPARITVMPASDRTRARAPGDLMAIRAQFNIKLSDYGVGVGDSGIQVGKVSDDLQLDAFMLMSTTSPDEMRR